MRIRVRKGAVLTSDGPPWDIRILGHDVEVEAIKWEDEVTGDAVYELTESGETWIAGREDVTEL